MVVQAEAVQEVWVAAVVRGWVVDWDQVGAGVGVGRVEAGGAVQEEALGKAVVQEREETGRVASGAEVQGWEVVGTSGRFLH
jgi:hypothetical protein